MTTIFVQDVTLRDGMHAIRHRIAPAKVGEIVAALDAAGVDAIETVGGAGRGKAIIILNPAEPPLIMRDTVLALVVAPDKEVQPSWQDEIRASIEKMIGDVAAYVPGYRLKQQVQINPIPEGQPVHTLLAEGDTSSPTHQVSVFLEVEGAAHYLPAYAGNLDIMTSAAVQVAERIAQLTTQPADTEKSL